MLVSLDDQVQSPEAEQLLLGALLLDSRWVADVMGVVRPEDFSLEENREICRTIYAMFRSSQHIDPVSVLGKLYGMGYYRDHSKKYLLHLMEITPTSANAARYARIVRDKAAQRTQAAEM